MTEDRKTPNQQNQNPSNQNRPGAPRRGEIPNPLKKGMAAAGGHVLHGAGMSASAQQSGRGLGESSLARNWDVGGEQSQDERGTVTTGPDTAPQERRRQQQVRQEQESEQQQQQSRTGQNQPGQNQAGPGQPDPNRGHEQPPLDETTPPDILARDPDVTKR